MNFAEGYPGLVRDRGWKEPEFFDLGTRTGRKDLQLALNAGLVRGVADPMDIFVENLCDYEHPGTTGNSAECDSYCTEARKQGDGFGKWVLFPWSGNLVHYPDKEDHQKLRTARNRDLITSEEQNKLLGKTVAVFGLSVGSNAVDAMLRSGIGGKYVIGDMDVLEPPNLNRINATYEQLGLSKVDILAQRISEVDPYIDQVHFRHGYSTDVKKRLTTESPDIIIEEVDNMTVMALLRIFAREHGVPLVSGTDIDLRSIIDIERYDRNGTRMFNGRLTDKDIRKLLQHDTAGDVNTEREKEPGAEDRVDDTTALMIKHLGLTNISLRMIRSSIGRHDLGDSFPQLGTTATMTGALVAVAAREILLGKDLKSGRYVENPRKTLALQCEHNVRQVTTTLASLMRYMRR